MEDLVRLDSSAQSAAVKKMGEYLRDQIKGQERAIRYFLERYELNYAGFNDPEKPLLVALLLGPSGVGKTLLAETLAGYFFESPHSLTKVSCAEYQESHKISSLIGSPPGYIGSWNPDDPDQRYKGTEPILSQRNIDKYDFEYQKKKTDADKTIKINAKEREKKIDELIQELILLEDKLDKLSSKNKKGSKEFVQGVIRYSKLEKELENLERAPSTGAYNPINNYRSIILFDEIEKANESLHRLLLEILDKGRLTLSTGKVTKFNNSFIFMTSNVGSNEIADLLQENNKMGFRGKTSPLSGERVDKEIYEVSLAKVKEKFAPEFIGRLNQIIVFRPLREETMKQILELQLRDFHTMLAKSPVAVLLKIDDTVMDFLIKKALTKYSEQGARRLKDMLTKYIREPLAKFANCFRIISSDIVYIKLEKDEKNEDQIVFYRAKRPKENKTKSN